MLKRLIPVILLFVALSAADAAAQRLSIQAYVDQTTTGEDEKITYTIAVSGDFQRLGAVEVPRLRGLTVQSERPSQHWTRRIIGGRQENELRLQWVMTPESIGLGQIGRATIEIDGQTYTTESINVRIVSQAERASAPQPHTPPLIGHSRPDVFLHAVSDRRTAYVGQQVVVDYVLYYLPEVHPRNARVVGAWDAPGFWRENLELTTPLPTRLVEIDGRVYESATVRRAAFFPTRAGQLTIDSLAISLDVLRVQRPGGPTGPVYNPFGERFTRETISTDQVTVDVRPLPDGAPASFSGSVGHFTLSAQPERQQIQSGEALRVLVRIQGDGNPATLEPTAWRAPQGVDAYPPSAASNVQRRGRRLETRHTHTYAFVPTSTSAAAIPALEWSYFDPEASAYRTLTTGPIPFEVIGPLTDAPERIHATHPPSIRTDAGQWVAVAPASAGASRYVVPGLFGLPPAALLALLLLRSARRRRIEDAPARRHRAALRQARQAVTEAAEARLSTAERARSFDRALRAYLRDRIGLPALTMTRVAIRDALHERGLLDAPADELYQIMGRLESIEFGRMEGTTLPSTHELLEVLNSIDHRTSSRG